MDLLLKLSVAFVNRLHAVRTCEHHIVLQDEHISSQAEWACGMIRTQAALDQRSHVRLVQVPELEGLPCQRCGQYFPNERALKTHIGHRHPEVNREAAAVAADLTRDVLGVDGMPVCRMCHKTFHGWQNLIRHVSNGRCHAMIGKPSEALVPTPMDLPFYKRAEQVQKLLSTGCLTQDTAMRDDLLKHCVVCRQWIGDPRHHKQHIKKTHADIGKRYLDMLTAAALKWGPELVSPCAFCGCAGATEHRSRHAKSCTVLFQALLACQLARDSGVVQNDGCGRPGDGVLPAPAAPRGRMGRRTVPASTPSQTAKARVTCRESQIQERGLGEIRGHDRPNPQRIRT